MTTPGKDNCLLYNIYFICYKFWKKKKTKNGKKRQQQNAYNYTTLMYILHDSIFESCV